MKIDQVKNLEIETIGEVSSIKAGISEESFSFLFEMMSKSLYSNPIGSIIREITSNCFDSHKEAEIDDPVIIKKSWDIEDSCHYIHFIDVGVGLSPDRIKNVYMNYFSSTKRDSNEQIGGFGLGSKTPLSYQDMFYIITRHERIEYTYILHRGESSPTLDLISEEETSKRNGTEIKIAIKENDMSAFTANMKQQLCYFDNVYVDGFNIQNIYKLFEGTYYKYRDNDQYSDNMHIVLGKVSYPISWTELKREPIEVPIAVKFEIGELVVTPNRENLRYTDEVKSLLNQRIDLCLEELKVLFNKENPEINNIFEFLEVKNTRPSIKFDEDTKLYLPKKLGFSNQYVYSPLKELPITIPNNPFFIYKDEFKVIHGKETYSSNELTNLFKSNIINTIPIYTINNLSNKSEIKNIFVNNARVISRPNFNYSYYCTALGLYKYEKYERYDTGGSRSPLFDYVKEDNRLVKQVPILGKAKIIKAYINHIKSLAEPLLKDYSALIVPEEFIRDYRLRMKESSGAYQRSLNQEIIVKINGSRRTMKVSDIREYHILVYALEEDRTKLYNIESLIRCRHTFSNKDKDGNYKKNSKQILFITIGKNNYKTISKLPNAIKAEDVLKPNRFFKRVIRDFATSIVLSDKLDDYNTLHNIIINRGNPYASSIQLSRIRPDLQRKVELLSKFVKLNEVKYFREEIIELADKYKLYNYSLLSETKELDKFFEGFSILPYICSDIPNDLLVQVVKPYKKRLYYKIYQKQFIKGFIDPKDNLNIENHDNQEERSSETNN